MEYVFQMKRGEEHCKAFLAQRTDAELGGMFDEMMGLILNSYKEAERLAGMTLTEAILAEAQQGNCVGLFGFSAVGKTVRELLPPGYDGEARARRGEVLPELVTNAIPTNLPLERKIEIAHAQAKGAMEAPDRNTVTGQVRSAVAVVVWRGLQGALAMRNTPNPPERPKTRDELLDAVFNLLKFSCWSIEQYERDGKAQVQL
jgi:hypothetical protein